MAVNALPIPRSRPRRPWLGRMCLRYVNWTYRRDWPRFVEMRARLKGADTLVPASGVCIVAFQEGGGFARLIPLFNRAYVGAPDYRRAGWVQAMALQATPSFDPALIWFAVHGGEAVGFCMARLERHGGRITGVGVLPEWRRRGVGTDLMRHAMAELQRRGRRYVRLGVAPDNEEGRRIYRRLGFREI